MRIRKDVTYHSSTFSMKGADHMLILQKPLESVTQREKEEIGNIPASIELARLPGGPKSFLIPMTPIAKDELEEKKLIYENLEFGTTCAGRPTITRAHNTRVSAVLTSDRFKKGNTSVGTSVFVVKCENEDRFPTMEIWQVASQSNEDGVEAEIVNYIIDIQENALFVIGDLRGNEIVKPMIIEVVKNETEARAESWGPSDYLDILPIPERVSARLCKNMDMKTGKVSVDTIGLKKLEPPKLTEE